ncbi:hypothetical protein SAMN04487914_1634 [Arthrobacter sp. ok909]|nr:hypothetical protein SAMN04487914_1634 [Arthrobacter sp. ok909]
MYDSADTAVAAAVTDYAVKSGVVRSETKECRALVPGAQRGVGVVHHTQWRTTRSERAGTTGSDAERVRDVLHAGVDFGRGFWLCRFFRFFCVGQ